MITIKSNIEFLTGYIKWRKGETGKDSFDAREMTAHIDYAIETLKMIDQLKDDAWDEKRQDIIGQNSNEGLHYEPH